MLAFGVLLRLAYFSRPDTCNDGFSTSCQFNVYGMECTQMASDQLGAFDYFDATMRGLLSTQPAASSFTTYSQGGSYDWQWPTSNRLIRIQEQPHPLDASVVAYTSIGLELLSSILSAFSDSILTCTENVAILANLAAVIFSNSDILCEPFWRDFETYDGNAITQSPNHQVSALLNAAYKLAATAINMGDERSLPSVAPLIRLLSSLCCTAEICAMVLTMLPPEMMRKTLLLCAPSGYVVDEEANAVIVLGVLESIHTMATMDQSMAFQDSLLGDGPRLIYRILSSTTKEAVQRVSLQLLTCFMNHGWAADASKLFHYDSLERYLANPSLSAAAIEVLYGFVTNMSTAVFNTTSDKETLEYLNVVLRSILEACSVFASSAVSISTKRVVATATLKILITLSAFIRGIRQIIALHPSPRVRAAASEGRDSLIQVLATNTELGCALAHAACSPVTTSLALGLEQDLAEANLLNLASEEYAVDEETNEFGAWRSIARKSSMPNALESVRARFRERLLKLQDLNVDIVAVHERGWVSKDAIHVAATAMEIVSLWATLVEDMLAERYDLDDALPEDAMEYIKSLSPYRLLSSLAIVPPPVRESSALSTIWFGETLTVFDVLSRYLVGDGPTSFELLTIGIRHGTAVGDHNPALKRALTSNGSLHLAVCHSLKKCCNVFFGTELTSDDKKIFLQGMKALTLAQSIIRSEEPQILLEGSILESLTQVVSAVAVVMKSCGISIHSRLAEDEIFLIQTRFAAEILRAFVLAFKRAGASLSKYFASRSFLEDLRTIESAIVSSNPSGSGLALRVSSVLNHVLSSCFELLAAQVMSEMNDQDSDGIATRIVNDSGLFGPTHDFLHFVGPVLTAQAFGTLSSRTRSIANVSQPSTLCDFFPSAITSRIAAKRRCDCDVSETVFWLSSLDSSEDFSAAVNDVDSALSLLDSELSLVSSWSRISQLLSLVSRVADTDKTCDVIRQFYQNCKGLEEAYEEDNEARVLATVVLSETFSAAIVSQIDQLESKSVDLLIMLTSILDKLTNLSSTTVVSYRLKVRLSESTCNAQQRLLASCSSIVISMQQNDRGMIDSEDMVLRLINATGLCVALASREQPMIFSGVRNLCTIALSILTLCITSGDGRASFYAKAAETIDANGVVELLVSRAIEVAVVKASQEAVAFVNATLMLISAIAEAGKSYPKISKILNLSQIPKLLVSSPLIISVSSRWSKTGDPSNESTKFRGYIQTDRRVANTAGSGGMAIETDRLLLSGKADPLHSLWVDTISVVRSLSRTPLACDIAFDFVATHESCLLSCLHDCSAASSESAPALTYNLIREATEVLSLLSELCHSKNKVKFERSYPALYHRFGGAAKAMLGSIAKFLGSSGTARELFSLLANMEALANQDGQADGYDQPQDIHPSFSAGLTNGRHEAIRNAHLARRCYALVTKSEYDASSFVSSAQGSSTQLSATTLEQNCQRAVSSPFNLKMEHAAALCLSYTISILWRTHPVASCFVMFTEEEASRLDSMSLVKPGMIIASRKHDRSNGVRFARVKRVDTVKRAWNVCYLQSLSDPSFEENTDAVVPTSQLAGVEDPMKRKTILKYIVAPDHAADLEGGELGEKAASVGHLIVALRWCYQYDGNSSSRDLAVRRSLAEGAAMLLGTELALHHEIRETEKIETLETTKRLNQQLYNMFDATPLELDGDLSFGTRRDRVGRLKKLLGPTTYKGIQQQLQSRIDAAKVTKQQQQEERKAALLKAYPWLHVGRNSF
jgi:hypothetical protein